jgi:hypothetical protein
MAQEDASARRLLTDQERDALDPSGPIPQFPRP